MMYTLHPQPNRLLRRLRGRPWHGSGRRAWRRAGAWRLQSIGPGTALSASSTIRAINWGYDLDLEI